MWSTRKSLKFSSGQCPVPNPQSYVLFEFHFLLPEDPALTTFAEEAHKEQWVLCTVVK
jgi:hypothetical protein